MTALDDVAGTRLFVPVVDSATNEEAGVYRLQKALPIPPRPGDWIELYDGVSVQVENIRMSLAQPWLEVFTFTLKDDADEVVPQLLELGFVEVDQHGEPVPAAEPEAEPEPVAVEQ